MWTTSACRRAVAICACVALSATNSDAFKVPHHVAITQDALTLVARQLPQFVAAALSTRGTGFTAVAGKEIVDANKARDLNHCGNEFDSNPAQPCTGGIYGEDLAALVFLDYEEAEDHFDAESIELGSNKLYAARRDIRDDLKRGDFVKARKVLGGALHSLQDFYAHSNYVELGLPGIETRLGKEVNAFSKSGRRIATKDEPMCLEGERLLTQLTVAQQNELIARYERAEKEGVDTKGITAAGIRKVIADRPLTSGIFYLFYPKLQNLTVDTLLSTLRDATLTPNGDLQFPNSGDPPEIVDGKCRHGWRVAFKHWSGAELVYKQAGINKDEPEFNQNGFRVARQRALDHSVQFILDVMKDDLAGGVVSPVNAVLGLMGYEPTTILTRITVGIPGAPNGESWDTAIGSALGFFVRGTQGLKNIQPDILICMESPTVPGVCLPLCDDADWSNELNAYVCSQPVDVGGWGTKVEPDLRVLLREVDLGDPKRVIANFRLDDPRACDPFCSYDLEPPGSSTPRPVWIRFEMKPVNQYGGPTRPRRILPPADAIPLAKPASATTGQTGSTTAPSSSTTAPSPSPSVPIASSLTSSTATASRSTTTAMTTAGAAAAPLRSPEGIDSRLSLRDADNCTGTDAFYTSAPPATLASAQGAQVYQMAAFSMAIADPAAKQSVLNAIRAKVGDDAFFTAMTAVIADPVQSQTLVTAYQNTTRNVAQKISTTGLASLLPSPIPPSAMQANVDRWVLARLSSPALVSRAIDLMSGARPLTAECTINELAKQGFTATVIPQPGV